MSHWRNSGAWLMSLRLLLAAVGSVWVLRHVTVGRQFFWDAAGVVALAFWYGIVRSVVLGIVGGLDPARAWRRSHGRKAFRDV